MKPEEIHKRESALTLEIKSRLPDLVQKVRDAEEGSPIILHQDAFGADYQQDEYTLLGMAIKYLGMFGHEIHIIGKNRETLK